MRYKKLGLVAILVSVAASDILAQTITNYSVGDVLVCFRKGSQDMVVDAGPISTFTNATGNQRITINQYSTSTQLSQVGTNGVSWSAFTWLGDYTLFITRPRSSPNLQSVPWADESSPAQSGVIGQMEQIPPGAVDEFNLSVYPNDSSTAVVEEDASSGNGNYTHGISYHDALTGAYGSGFDGYFEGNPENTTTNSGTPSKAFTGLGQPQRSDFYQLTPTSGHVFGKWLGYFEFNTNGVMTYVAYPTVMPVIASINRSGATSTITYQTGLYGTYTLLGTNNLSGSYSTWPVVGTLSTGDTSLHTVQDTDSVSNKFYIIQGQ